MGVEKPTIGVKFCGGCNPYYDRGAFFSSLKEKLSGQCSFVYQNCPHPVGMLIICGCERACPTKQFEPSQYRFLIEITQHRRVEEVASEIIEKLGL